MSAAWDIDTTRLRVPRSLIHGKEGEPLDSLFAVQASSLFSGKGVPLRIPYLGDARSIT